MLDAMPGTFWWGVKIPPKVPGLHESNQARRALSAKQPKGEYRA